VLPDPVLPDSVLPDRARATRVAVLFDDDCVERLAAARRLADSIGATTRCPTVPVVRAVRPTDCSSACARNDPYRLADHLRALCVDAAIFVAPRRRGSRRLLPGPVVEGVPVGIVQADSVDHLAHVSGPAVGDSGPDPHAPWVIAAMAKNVFLDATDDWAERLGEVHDAIDLRADRARRVDLLDGLAGGPGVVLYAGHGSPRGWAGYQALRLEHVTGVDGSSAGLIMAFACKTLARHRQRWPFGSSLVETGAARAYLAPATTVMTADAEQLAEIVVDLLIEMGSRSDIGARVCDLVRLIEQRCRHDAAACRAWATFRLIGDPLAPLGLALSPAGC